MPYLSISALYQKPQNTVMPKVFQVFALATVVLGHGLLLGLVVQQVGQNTPVVVAPTIQGVVIMAQTTPKPVMQPVMQPVIAKTMVTPSVTPKVNTLAAIKNAPPSEQAITQPEVVETPATVESTPQIPVAESIPVVVASAKPAPEPVEEVTPPRSDAAYLNNPAPVYPPMSQRLGEQGRVLLDVYILANGTVGELRIKQSSGFSRLDQAALQTVKKWQFQPAKRGHQAIDYWYVLPLSFTLN